ncbi:MAG TPA: TolC family protein, partial [Limnochordia bacterium]|nr:TolC family protein [Limnochordia bacterium]
EGRLDDAQFAFTQGIGDLNDLLGLPRDAATALPDVAAPEFDVTLLAAQAEATANRRELAAAARAQGDAAQNLVEAKQDAGIQVDGFAGFSNGTNKPLSRGAWSIGVDVDVPILYGAARGGDIERAKIDQAAAQRNFDEVKRSVAADVDQRYHDWTSAKRDVDFAQAAAEQAQKALAATRTRVDAGIATGDDLDTATEAARAAEADLQSAILQLRITVDRLQVAMGRHLTA